MSFSLAFVVWPEDRGRPCLNLESEEISLGSQLFSLFTGNKLIWPKLFLHVTHSILGTKIDVMVISINFFFVLFENERSRIHSHFLKCDDHTAQDQ